MPGKPLIFKAFRASLTLVPARYVAAADAALGGDLDLIHRVGVGQSQIGQGKKLAHKRDLLILWGVRPSV